MKKLQLFLISLLSLLLFSLAGQAQPVAAADKLELVTTFYPIYEFTKNIAGDQADVTLLIKAGTEVHDFEPSSKDIAKIEDADAFIYADDNMETWVGKVKKSLAKSDVDFVKATGDMLLLAGSEEEHNHGEGEDHNHAYDPHVWLSPQRAIGLVENIRDALVKKFPDQAEDFKKNAAAYIKKLEALDADYQEALASAKQKSFVTQHAAFSYLALDYGLTQISITGVSAESEPSAKRLAELSDYIKKNKIKYIYFEENASDKVAKTLADEASVKTAVLNPLESLTQKQMDKGQDYFSVMRANLKALKKTTDVAGKTIEPETDSSKTVYNGYFKDKNVKKRSLSDWSGDWQSVYPYLLDGSLDQLWDYKSKLSQGDMSAADYKDYYDKGYQTDVEGLTIDGKKKTITFKQAGKEQTFSYKYSGYEILTYEKGNRGVRYLFEAEDENAGDFKYVQFSDHGIAPQDSGHFHIYWGGDSQAALLEELDNWPTYYPSDMTGQEIAQEMLAH